MQESLPGVMFRAGGTATPRRALFLDRDGVINVDRRYVHRIADFEFMPGVLDAAARFAQSGHAIVVVTNQAGIARGYYGVEDFYALTRWMGARFAEAGAPLDAVYFCPHHPEATVAQLRCKCVCRKPEPGMIRRAALELNLELPASILVGDKFSDIAAGRAAGVGRCILVRSADHPQPSADDLPQGVQATADAVVPGLPAALDRI